MTQDDKNEFDYFKATYLRDLYNGNFPWEAAYYYYVENINRIDIMPLADFREQIEKQSLLQPDEQGKWFNVSKPIYENLHKFFEIEEELLEPVFN